MAWYLVAFFVSVWQDLTDMLLTYICVLPLVNYRTTVPSRLLIRKPADLYANLWPPPPHWLSCSSCSEQARLTIAFPQDTLCQYNSGYESQQISTWRVICGTPRWSIICRCLSRVSISQSVRRSNPRIAHRAPRYPTGRGNKAVIMISRKEVEWFFRLQHRTVVSRTQFLMNHT